MNIHQIKKHAKRCIDRKAVVENKLAAEGFRPGDSLGGGDSGIRKLFGTFEFYTKALEAIGNYKWLYRVGLSPFRRSIPKKKQRQLGILCPVGAQNLCLVA